MPFKPDWMWMRWRSGWRWRGDAGDVGTVDGLDVLCDGCAGMLECYALHHLLYFFVFVLVFLILLFFFLVFSSSLSFLLLRPRPRLVNSPFFLFGFSFLSSSPSTSSCES